MTLGVPTFKKMLSDWAGRYIFCTIFHEDSKNIIFFKIGHTQSTPKLCLACLLSFDEQPGWAELGRRLGVPNLEKNHIFGILMKSCTKYVSAIKIRDVVGTPTVMAISDAFLTFIAYDWPFPEEYTSVFYLSQNEDTNMSKQPMQICALLIFHLSMYTAIIIIFGDDVYYPYHPTRYSTKITLGNREVPKMICSIIYVIDQI